MPGEPSVTLADVYELIAKEHAITSTKLEGLRAEGRMREETLIHAISNAEVSTRAYVDSLHSELKASVENETVCLQVGIDKLRTNIFGNGDVEHSLAYRVKLAEMEQTDIKKLVRRWEKIVIGILSAFGVPMTLGLLTLLWLLLVGKAELILH